MAPHSSSTRYARNTHRWVVSTLRTLVAPSRSRATSASRVGCYTYACRTNRRSSCESAQPATHRRDEILSCNEERLLWSLGRAMSELPARRLHVAGTRARVSFVVAWQGCPTELSQRLRVWDRWVDDGIDVVVVASCPPTERQRIERSHPGVRVVNASANEELSTLRQRGVSAARGDIVVIIDDAVGRTSSWRDHLPVAIGGAVLPAHGAQWVGFEQPPRGMDDVSLR